MADLRGCVPPQAPTISRTIPSQLLTLLLALLASGAIVLVLSGFALVAATLLTPILLLTSPVWVPLGIVLLAATAGALSVIGLVAVAGVTLAYKCHRWWRPVAAERVDRARSRVLDTARGYGGGYFHGKVRDVAPGA